MSHKRGSPVASRARTTATDSNSPLSDVCQWHARTPLTSAYRQRRQSSQPCKAEVIPLGRHLCCLPPLERLYQPLALWNQCVASVATTTSMCLTSVLHVNEMVSYNRRTTWRHESDMSLSLLLSLTNFCMILFRQREGRRSLVKSALSCVSGSDRHAEHQLFQSTHLPISGIVGWLANVAETLEATIHAHLCWLQNRTAFARRRTASLSRCSCLAAQAITGWKPKVSSESSVSTPHSLHHAAT